MEKLASLGAIDSVHYRDPSAWRKILNLRLSPEQKANNKMVSQGKIRGRITPKHLSVLRANELFNLELLLKDNDKSDALLLAWSFIVEGK